MQLTLTLGSYTLTLNPNQNESVTDLRENLDLAYDKVASLKRQLGNSLADYDNLKAEHDRYRDNLVDAQTELETLKLHCNEQETELQSLRSRNDRQGETIRRYHKAIDDRDTEIARMSAEITAHLANITDLRNQLGQANDKLAKLAPPMQESEHCHRAINSFKL